MKQIFVWIGLIGLCSCADPKTNNPVFQLLGKWQSVSDARYQLEFTKDKLRHYYDGKLSESSTIMADSDCKSQYCSPAENPENGFCFNEKGPYGEQCNLVLYVDENRLEYKMVGGRGNSQVFTKLK